MRNDVSINLKAKDEASGTFNKVAGNVNSFAKQVSQTIKPLNNLAKSLNNLSKVAPGLNLIGKSFSKISAAIKSSVSEVLAWEKAWAKAEQSIKKIDFAASINGNLRATSKELQKFGADLSSKLKNAISAGDINNAISGIAFDKTADQIKDIISVAPDIAKLLGSDLETAVSQLNATFAGTTGQLGKMFPELKNLSKEALESGKAVDFIRQKVDGLSESLNNSSQSSIERYQNTLGDFKEELGRFVTDAIKPFRDGLTSLIGKLTQFLSKYNEARALVTDSNNAREYLRTNQNKLSNASDYSAVDSINAQAFLNGYHESLLGLNNSIIDKKKALAQYQYSGQAGNAAETQKSIDVLESQRTEMRQLYDLANHVLIQYGANLLANGNAGTGGNGASGTGSSNPGTKENPLDDLIKSAKEAGLALAQHKEETQKNAWAMESAYHTSLAAMDKEAEERRKLAEQEAKEAEERRKAMLSNNFVTNNTGELGSYFAAGVTDGASGVLTQFAGQILQTMAQESGIINTFYNSVSYFIDQFVKPLINLIEPIINPVLILIQSLGQAVGSILTILQPFIDIVTPLIEGMGYTLTWITKFLQTLADSLATIFVSVQNWLVDIYNALNGWGKDKEHISPNKTWKEIGEQFSMLFSERFDEFYKSSLENNYATLQPASSGATGASYTAARDISVNINYVQSFVNGDADEIAINLARRIRDVEKLGLI